MTFSVANAIRRILRYTLLIALAGLIVYAFPLVLEGPLYAFRLLREPAPDSLPIPVAGVSAKALRDSWYAPRDGGRRRHEGIDIFAPRGTPVRATTRGLVLWVGENRLGGNVVWVLGPGGMRHYYAHLDRFSSVRAGDRINAGDVLGYVGTTGNARGAPPHLHYAIYRFRDGAINPFPLLATHHALMAGEPRPAQRAVSRA